MKIACGLWEINENISDIKSIHLPFFDDMFQVEIYMLRALDVMRQGCIELAGIALFGSQHILETHSVCVWARVFKSDKIPNRFESR